MINFLIPSHLKVLSIQEMKIDDSSIIMIEFFVVIAKHKWMKINLD